MNLNIFKKIAGSLSADGKPRTANSEQPGKEVRSTKSIPMSNPRNIYSLFTNEFANLDLDRIKSYFEISRKGLNFWKSLFFDYIRREDLHIGGVCQTRKLAVVGKLRSAINADGLEGLISGEDEALKEYLIESFKQMNIANLLTDIVEAQIQGVSIFEKNFKLAGGKIVLDSLNIIPNHLILYDDVADEYNVMDVTANDAWLLRSLSSNTMQDRINLSAITKVAIDKHKLFEVHSFDGNNQNGFLNGCIDSLIIGYYFKRYGISDWATYLELFATPPRIGKYDPLASTPEDIRQLENGVQNFASNSWAVLSKNSEIIFPGDPGRKQSSDLFSDYIKFFNESISIRVLGQTLTTNVGDKGSYAAANIHNTVREDILNSDIMLIEDSLNRLSRELIDMNFSGVTDYPAWRFPETRGLADKKILSEILTNLSQAGYTPDIEVLVDEFGFELTREQIANSKEQIVNNKKEQITNSKEQITNSKEQITNSKEQDISEPVAAVAAVKQKSIDEILNELNS